jgi:chromosome segregation ATPase
MGKRADLRRLQDRLSSLEHDLDNFEPDDDELESLYDEFLDELYLDNWPECLSHIRVSTVIKDYDTTGYNCGRNDWFDSERQSRAWLKQFDGYEEIQDQIDDVEIEISDLEAEIEELEERLEELEDGDAEIDNIRDELG